MIGLSQLDTLTEIRPGKLGIHFLFAHLEAGAS